jgi:hypothetical protein
MHSGSLSLPSSLQGNLRGAAVQRRCVPVVMARRLRPLVASKLHILKNVRIAYQRIHADLGASKCCSLMSQPYTRRVVSQQQQCLAKIHADPAHCMSEQTLPRIILRCASGCPASPPSAWVGPLWACGTPSSPSRLAAPLSEAA